jgi:hypothetical protein
LPVAQWSACTETGTTGQPGHEDGEITTSHEDAINKEEKAMAKLGKSKTEKAKQAMGKKTKPEKARAKLAKKTDEAGKKVRKADRKASKKTKKTIKP